MQIEYRPGISRRNLLAAGAGLVAAPAAAQPACEMGLPGHVKGPPVWRDLDQAELDAAYDQEVYQPITESTNERLKAASYDLRVRRGYPDRAAYGEAQGEGLDIYRAPVEGAPVLVFVHGGTWRGLDAAMSGFAAEPFLDRGAHFVALDFSDVRRLDGDLARLADQVCRGIAWVARNAASFGGDPERIYLAGHSSGAHLAAVAVTADWTGAYGLPAQPIRAALCLSGMYDMEPVRLSWRSKYLAFTDEMEDAMSPQRHLDRIDVPMTVAFGTLETPEFQRQAEDFAAALEAAGQPVELVRGISHYHQDMWESLGNPYGVSGRAALAMMGL